MIKKLKNTTIGGGPINLGDNMTLYETTLKYNHEFEERVERVNKPSRVKFCVQLEN